MEHLNDKLNKKQTSVSLIDELIDHWGAWDDHEDYYLNELAPQIVSSNDNFKPDETENKIIPALKQLLSPKEWQQLPKLIKDRRAGRLKEIESDRKREEEKQKKKLLEEKKKILEEEKLRKQEEALAKRQKAFAERYKDIFEVDFLKADSIFNSDPDAPLIGIEGYKNLKTEFVQKWSLSQLDLELDSEQAAAIATGEGDIQVVARAGSGKTRILVTRAIFLQQHCHVNPSEILLMAFNKDAANEMEKRLDKAVGKNTPHVMTFHALAHAFVHPEEDIVYDDQNRDNLGLSRELQEVIDKFVRSEEYGVRIRDLMLAHFREDWEKIINGHFQYSMKEFLDYKRALPRESLKGDYVKSFGEKLIANTLFEYGVEYRYEQNFRWSGFNYKPDFTLSVGQKSGIIIEYFGLKGDADYDEQSKKKREFWTKKDEWKFLEFCPNDISSKGVKQFRETLVNDLKVACVTCKKRSEEGIWELVRKRAIDKFTGAIKTFVSRCRKQNLSPDDLAKMVKRHTSISDSEEVFLKIVVLIYERYISRLASKKKEDFDGLMWRAIYLLRNKETKFVRDRGRERGNINNLRFILIDEFQDFSQMFFEIIKAIRLNNQQVRFFCVGDNWQAINGFAGADLNYFENFSDYFKNSEELILSTNYRSSEKIIDVSNALMDGLGVAAKAKKLEAGSVQLCKLNKFKPSEIELSRHNSDEVTPALLRILRKLLDSGEDIVMLSRRNGVPWYVDYSSMRIASELERFLDHIRSFLPEDDRGRVTIKTAHKYKGLESNAVVILDANEGSYPLIHPNWHFLRVFGDNLGKIESEERRLFYVAITRAQNSCFILTDALSQSPYINDISQGTEIKSLNWDGLPPVASQDGHRLEVRVFNSYEVKDELKNLNYRWNSADKCWQRAFPAEGFSLELLLKQKWAKSKGVKIKVYAEDGKPLH